MKTNLTSQGQALKPSRTTLRLNFRVADGEVKLISHRRLNKLTPPSVGEYPRIGKHGGFWMELRDANDQGLFHRVLLAPLGGTREVHAADGTSWHVPIPTTENIFQVLLPDYRNATSIVFCGKYLDAEKFKKEQAQRPDAPAPPTRVLARFDIPKGDNSGNSSAGGGK